MPPLYLAGCVSVNNTGEPLSNLDDNKLEATSTATATTVVDELLIEDLIDGTGEEAVNGKLVTVHYTGTLTNGKKFDSSLDRNEPFQFTLGEGRVIQGWEQGLIGMKVDGKRKLTIPASLAYGDQGAGSSIPPGATLIFEIELLKVE